MKKVEKWGDGLGRPTKKETDKKQTKEALTKALKNNGLSEKFYTDQVEEYMKYFDNLAKLNELLTIELNIDVLKEKRQVTKEMRSILAYLGLKPQAEGGVGGVEDL